MSINYQPLAFSQLQQFLANGLASRHGPAQLSHIQAAAHLLGMRKAPFIMYEIDSQLKGALLVGLDEEWYESGPKRITELGISTLPLPQGPLARPIQALNDMEVHHMRLKETAHMVNGEKCAGHPERFQFGTTCFVDASEAKQALTDIFLQYDSYGNLRPIVLFGHAVDNDIDMLRESFNFDLAALGVVVMVLDTQRMAKELGMGSGNLMSLKNVLAQYSVEEKFLHNAGNDIAQTMIAAALLAGELTTGRGRYHADNQIDVDNLKVVLRNRSLLYWGVRMFCTNCDSTEHLVSQCPHKYICARCASNPSWKHAANTHPLMKCARPAFPCKACVESIDKKRQKGSMTHYIEDCRFEKSKSGMFYPP